MKFLHAAFVAGALAAVAQSASAAVVITEIDPFGSNGSNGYSADWFELTNTSGSAISIVGWTMVDNHAASNSSSPYASGATVSIANSSKPAAALTLASGQTTLGAGQSAIFLESANNAASSGALIQAFEQAWFGSKVPAGLLVGTYNDTSNGNFGLSQTADMVNIFSGSTNSSSLVASVAFGADTGTPVGTFDNAAGLNDATLTLKSAVGVDGAFLSATGLEVGSPGVSAVPLPDTSALLLSGLGVFGVFALGRKRLLPR
jgi:hypothetical protein